jgi:hypothetical protein
VTCKDLILRTLPLWVTILVLLVTRIQQIGLKGILQRCVMKPNGSTGVQCGSSCH